MLYLYRNLQKIVVFVGIFSICCSCSDKEDEKLRQTIPFKSISVNVDNEIIEAKLIDEKNLSLSFEAAENFSEAKLSIELNQGYEIIFPIDLTKADLSTYPVVNFRAPDNRIIKYWFVISSKAFPIIDATKIGIEGIGTGNIVVQNSNKEVIIDFDKTKMDMTQIKLFFEEGSMVADAEADGDLVYDFTKGLSQQLIIKYGGVDREYKVVLNLAKAMENPQKYGFANVTNEFVNREQYPFLAVFRASSILNVPINNIYASETPWSWDYPWDQVDEYLGVIGNWEPNRTVESINGIDFSYVTIDIKEAKARLVSNDQRQISFKDVSALISLSGLSVNDQTIIYYNGKVLNNNTSDGTPWRSAIGFSDQGEISFHNAAIVNGQMVKLSFNTDFVGPDYLNSGTIWDVKSAVCSRPWLVRNGHLMTRDEMYKNDGTGWEIGLGEAWNGKERSRSFIGVTYDNKIGCAVINYGLSIPQAAWILNKLGWKDVFFIGGSYWMDNEFQTTLSVNKKLVSGNINQVSQYCIAIDSK